MLEKGSVTVSTPRALWPISPASGWCSHRIEVGGEVQGLRNDLLQGMLHVLHPGNVFERHIDPIAVDNISRHLGARTRIITNGDPISPNSSQRVYLSRSVSRPLSELQFNPR